VSPSTTAGEYELIAGERRWRASRLAGLKDITALVRIATEKEKFQLSIIENIHRADLNPIEEAFAYQRVMEEFSLTQDELSQSIGIGRSHIANTLRLLNLPDYIKDAITAGDITAGQARALVVIDDEQKQKEIARRIITEKLSAREIEKIVGDWKSAISSGRVGGNKKKTAELLEIENELQRVLGTKVAIKSTGKKGWLSIAFYSLDHFDSIVSTLKGRFSHN
jgi:ParB family chromosome partitioning protein